MSVQRFVVLVLLAVALVLPASAPAAQAQLSTPAGGSDWRPSQIGFRGEAGPVPSPQTDRFRPSGLDRTAPPEYRGAAMPFLVQTEDGSWMMPTDALQGLPETAPQASGGPDDFGYVFNSVPLSWIDASSGTDTGISSTVDSAGPIDIGFPFKYYENTYSQLWVSRFGFLAFNNVNLYRSQSEIPNPSPPNDVIAPHWIPSYHSPEYVRYLRGGVAPNRWFVIEWNRQRSDCCSGDPAIDEFTFQVVLHENGDILFQYQDMRVYGGYYCQASGIEDSVGSDGLSITQFCRPVNSYQAVRITRPAPAARVRIFPQHYGALFYPGETSSTRIPIRNTGELGTDTYNITLDSLWLTSLVHENGITALTDTNGDGIVDTGPIAQGVTKVIIVKVWTAPSAQVGNTNTATLTARSTRDNNVYKTAIARITMPASFAQVYSDDADGAMSMMLVTPEAQAVRPATGDWHWGYSTTVGELPNHNLIYVWSKSRCLNDNCTRYGYEIEYTILNPYGETVRPITRLVDHSGATVNTYDYVIGVAVAPDGRMGLAFYRYLWNSSTSQYNYNIHWAALNASGDLIAGPINVTNNTQWGASGALDIPHFYASVITAGDDGRFFLAWTHQQQTGTGWIVDVWYAVLNSSGGVVRNATKLTDSTTGATRSQYYSPSITSLTGNRALLAFTGYTYPPGNTGIYYAALGGGGAVQHPITRLTTGGWGSRPDAVQLSNGRVVVAWTGDAPANPDEQGWTGQYFNNENLAGHPVVTRTDPNIDFRWDLGSPAAGVNPDHFSVRWQGTITVPGGDYSFTMGSDDGSRLWIDGELVMDYWNTCCQYWTRKVTLTPGVHSVRMEMREIDGAAWAYLHWRDAESPLIQFAVLDANLNRVAGPSSVGSLGALTGNDYVSVTSDANNRAIFTWMDYVWSNRRNLYYALVDSNGAVVTPATIFQTSRANVPRIESSFYGYGNTTFRWTPPAGVDSVLLAAPTTGFAQPGGAATPIAVELQGRGGSPATTVRLTATLDPRLSYVSDTSGVTPTVSGQTVTWNLPNLRLYDIRRLQINLRSTGGSLGALLPVQLQLMSAEPDLTPGNNQATVQVRISQPFYLPLLIRR